MLLCAGMLGGSDAEPEHAVPSQAEAVAWNVPRLCVAGDRISLIGPLRARAAYCVWMPHVSSRSSVPLGTGLGGRSARSG